MNLDPDPAENIGGAVMCCMLSVGEDIRHLDRKLYKFLLTVTDFPANFD
jgi:hypothetical protein